MNVTFLCPSCDQTVHVRLALDAPELHCPACNRSWAVPQEAVSGGSIAHCLICPSKELYVRKDFSQKLGVAIVVIGVIVSSIFWAWRMPLWTYGVLFATALIDVVLYLTVGNLLQCYRCQTQYREVPGLDDHAAFDLETHEKHRQQRIRLAQQTKPVS
jgi:hypothetical protein